MSLNLLFGPSGSGKTHKLFEYALSEAKKHPDINYYVIVPEQFTLKTQRQLVDMSDCHGILNVDVLSFARLAFRIFEEVGFSETSGLVMDDMGKNLVIRYIAARNTENLTYLSDNMKKLGYITQVKSLISEMKQYKIGQNELEKMLLVSKDNGKATLYRKLDDIKTLYEAFDLYIKDKYTTTEELLDLAAKEVNKSKKIKNSVILFDGYTGFTPVQYSLIESLLVLAKDVFITLLTDTRDELKYNSEHELFYLSYETENKLRKISERNNVKVSDVILKETVNKRFSPEKTRLIHLEKNLFREYKKPYILSDNITGDRELPTKAVNDEISVISMLSPSDEVEILASKVKNQVVKHGFRYRDIAVVTGDMETYVPLIQRIFPKYDIPFFSDKKNPVLMNPFIEYLRALVDIYTEGWTYESMFRFLRTALSGYKTDDIDMLENFVLKNGIKGYGMWNTSWEEKYTRNCKNTELERLKSIDIIRGNIVDKLSKLQNSITYSDSKTSKKPTKTVNELNASIYAFLEANEVQKHLAELTYSYSITDDSFAKDRKKEFEKVYEYTIDLLDKLSELLGNEEITLSEYGELLDAGFDEIRIGLIPTVTDYIQVGDIVRSRFSDIRTLYIIGANDGVIPAKGSSSGILSDIEKEFIVDNTENISFAPTARMQSYTGQLYLYMLMTKPKDNLVISYSRLNSSSESIKPSYIIKTLSDLFPDLCIERDSDAYKDIYSIETAFDVAVRALSNDDTSNSLLSYFYNNDAYKERMEKIIDSYLSAGVLEGKDSISKAVASVLYGSSLKGSVTKLERFAECAYRNFLENGLSLKERELFDFKAPDMGSLFHGALENYSKLISENNQSWTEISDELREDYINIAVKDTLESGNFDVLYSSFRNKYMINRLERIIRRSVEALTKHLSSGKFQPLDAEVEFSSMSNLSAFNFKLSETERLHLSGKIDRIDTYEDEDRLFVKIIDYKSGNKKFNLLEIYKGLSLQLVVYMNAAMEMLKEKTEKEVVPAGILYYHVDDPVVDVMDDTSEDIIAEKIYSELKLRGMVNDEEGVYRLMDSDFEKTSKIIPVTLKNDGSFAKESSVASEDDFKIISDYVNMKVQDLGRDILSGNIKALPQSVKGQDDKACGYCPYKNVCKYDSLPSDEADDFTTKDKDEIIAKMKEDLSE